MTCTCRLLFAVAIAITVSPSAVSQQGFAPPTPATQSERKLELRKLEREVSDRSKPAGRSMPGTSRYGISDASTMPARTPCGSGTSC